MEMYRGLAILTSNMRSALDGAFTRRLRFIIEFPFPGVDERAAIWARAFPRDVPIADLAVDRLAQLNITGGIIRNIALGAAFLAADAGSPVRMDHLRQAVDLELLKLERTATEAELGEWS
jgi:SpoVK/Ycf46/Vps4 family AAA+-type ATPase